VNGVCHGCQLLTEKLGGRLDYIDAHMDSHHMVTYNDQQYLVNSYHNVRVETLPPGATALAHDPDGNVEAWIRGNIASVMWHPERMIDPWIPSEIQKLLS
jgi:gamma-glutamyl-gamma-aminobutyrate hydrolase PuuD